MAHYKNRSRLESSRYTKNKPMRRERSPSSASGDSDVDYFDILGNESSHRSHALHAKPITTQVQYVPYVVSSPDTSPVRSSSHIFNTITINSESIEYTSTSYVSRNKRPTSDDTSIQNSHTPNYTRLPSGQAHTKKSRKE